MPTNSPAMTAMTIDMYLKSLISEWMNYLFFPYNSLYAKINIFSTKALMLLLFSQKYDPGDHTRIFFIFLMLF